MLTTPVDERMLDAFRQQKFLKLSQPWMKLLMALRYGYLERSLYFLESLT